MLSLALQAEIDEYIRRHEGERDENNYALVVRNGRSHERAIQCDAGELKIQASRVYDKRPGHKFTSSILSPYMLKSLRLEEAVPILYLRGLSIGDFGLALSAQLGEEAFASFSATTVTRLLTIWQDEFKA